MPAKSDVHRAIARAESLLPGVPAQQGKVDRRWQAIIHVSHFIESDPEPVWEFICRWAKSSHSDVRAAVATCLLEHLLEHHFDEFFPRVRRQVASSARFADTFSLCAAFGQVELSANLRRFQQLKRSIHRRTVIDVRR